MTAAGTCPGCGAPLVFRAATSVVAVCPYCQTASARGDVAMRDLGKVASVFLPGSVLELGLRGALRDPATGKRAPFTLVGHTQLAHAKGGTWDEWYASFDDGRWGYLAEAQGRLSCTFEMTNPPAVKSAEHVQPGQQLSWSGNTLTVAERGRATIRAEEGELPSRSLPGDERPFVDVAAPNGVFGTLDFTTSPAKLYLGREVSLDDLGLEQAAVVERAAPVVASSQRLGCPRCGSPIALRVPGSTLGLACPSCAAVLSVEEDGRLAFLDEQAALPVKPVIALGKRAQLCGEQVEVVGFVVRSVSFDGEKLYFTEYLLHAGKGRYVWLVCSDDHWLFVRPLPPGDVTAESGRTDDGAHRTHDGRDFRPFQASTAWVEGVLGELYWKARVGDRAGMLDLVSPPYMLSRERTDDEVAWSLGVYVPVRDVEKAFAVKLPRPSRVGPAQPNPHTPRVLGALVNTALCFVVAAIATAAVPQRKVLENTLALDARAVEAPQAFFFESVALRGHRNVRIHVDNPPPFALVQGSFVAASGAPLRTFSFVTAEDETLRLSAFPEGNYGLRLAFVRPAPSNAASVRVRIDQGRPGVAGLLWFTLLMSAPLLFFVVARSMFEKQRFEDSTF